ncbi:MAG: 3-isopropylmalate dehydratase small subunit [Deltaproteobacteria bacterium HGW-Deltaproteobacteria-14]|jgi:3-isopropylmalate/(R)-2-methylmalate dehydratase small subunit|nr:MAG: 3-isopropylmalate dehydratase small subunit [Deltaproteobacteria bacterium HGW-Deltaproteobacteria-14]
MERYPVPLVSRALLLPHENVDTDQITPARFLRGTSQDGLADALFHDWRKDPGFVLNQPGAREAQVLVAGDNFGCGSSREHAPWALVAWGFRAIVSTSFADIFRNNSLKNGLLPVVVPPETHRALFARVGAAPETELTIDLDALTLSAPGVAPVGFSVDPFARHCLLEGVDELGYLVGFDARITAFEAAQARTHGESV